MKESLAMMENQYLEVYGQRSETVMLAQDEKKKELEMLNT